MKYKLLTFFTLSALLGTTLFMFSPKSEATTSMKACEHNGILYSIQESSEACFTNHESISGPNILHNFYKVESLDCVLTERFAAIGD